ncbi:protein RIC-3-like isoform X2 [Sinocyclocheilus anshuiensis]|uniref:protein RIC-3-like isoform X2 n=1 Tax=Sinocyclocheilus anshuiensis TaxID=1608454 RepID=UPI0007B9154E|nr:PREDICTED: protein RIC-3-like isoform X2 [Sinocyclocheilus anshuiensis]
MAVSTCQKITFISCIVLCMSLFLPKLFLPRVKKETVQSEVGPGHFPPPRHRHSFSEDHDHWDADSHYIKHYNPEAIARAKGVGKPNLLGQVIPVYGFGIFLYIIYLFFKLTSKDKPHQQGCRFPILQSEYTFEEMPTCQLVQMQARMSEKAREKRISKVVHPSARSRRDTRRREERKLKQLEITQMMRERQLREGASPEEEAEEAPYTADWEGYPEETYPEFDMPSRRRRFPSVILEEPDQVIPTAEELAERMKEEEEEDEPDDACTNEEVKEENNEGEKEEDDKDEEEEEEEDEDEIGEDQPCLPKSIDEDDEKLEYPGEKEEEQKPSRRRQITFSDHRHVFHYPKGGAVGCKYEEEEEEEHDGEEEEDDDDEGNEEEENGDDEDCEEEEEEDLRNEDGQSETEKEEEDPLMEAESLGFNDEVECDPEEQEVDLIDFLQTYQPEVTVISNKSESPKAQASGTLRMRHKKQKVKK